MKAKGAMDWPLVEGHISAWHEWLEGMKEMTLGDTSGVDDGSGRTTIEIAAILIHDDDGNYFIHGMNKASPQDMFKTMLTIWNMNPAYETARFVEFQLSVPRVIGQPKVLVHNADDR